MAAAVDGRLDEDGAQDPRVRLEQVPRLAGILVLLISATVLLGWVIDVRALQSFMPGWVTMKVNAALCLGLGATSLMLLNAQPGGGNATRLARVCAALVVAVGVATLTQYIFDVDLGIDQFLVSAEEQGSPTPGRMAGITALTFVLIGGALLTAGTGTVRGTGRAQAMALAATAIALTSLLGLMYGIIPTVGHGHGIEIAAHTALAIVILSAGTLALDANTSWLRTLLSPRAGGALARRLLPVAFVLPLVLGALRQTSDWLQIGPSIDSSAVVGSHHDVRLRRRHLAHGARAQRVRLW